jgi:hypothetical protein
VRHFVDKKGASMKPQEQEILKIKDDIQTELKAVLEKNLTIFGWDIPENDDRKAAEMIWEVMQESMVSLKKEIDAGKYGD